MNSVSKTRYCYHCRAYHPEEEMRQVVSKTGKRWRCIKSIKGANGSLASREAFGRAITEANLREMDRIRRFRFIDK